MTQYTLNDLAVRTLRDLNIIAADEVPAPEDLTYTIQTIQSEFAKMDASGIHFENHATTVNSINHVLFTELSARMGFAIGPAFGVLSVAEGIGGKSTSENNLRILCESVKTPELLTIERAARGTNIRDPIISQ